MKISFFVDTMSKYLCDWLEDFTGDAPDKQFHTEKARIVIQRARPSSPYGSRLTMGMNGTYMIPEGINSETAYDIGNVIEFKMISLTPNRIEIAAECNQPVVTPYFIYLLSEMNKRWPQTADVVTELARIKKAFETGLAELKAGQSAIYAKIGGMEQYSLQKILEAVQQGRIEQGEIQRTIDAIRRTLKNLQSEGVAINDADVKKALDDIYCSISSSLDVHHQFELSLPVIPFLLEYKLGIGGNVDLIAIWNRLKNLAHQDKK